MILCNLCAKHQATVYFKGFVNGQAMKLHLCDACAKKKGMATPFGESIFSLADTLNALAAALPAAPSQTVRCEGCGLSYPEFQQTSQMGCSECFKTFAPLVGPLLERIHGSRQHLGKRLSNARSSRVSLQDLARLKMELRESVEAEAYEKAAQLRDQIRDLEERLKTPETPGGSAA